MYICKLICYKMLKSIILFFRKRKIKKNLQRNRQVQFPDLNKYPLMSVLVDGGQKKDVKEMETFIKSSFNPKRLRFIVLSETIPENLLQSEYLVFIVKEDFSRWGILKDEKEEVLKSFTDDIFINLSHDNEELINDYMVSYIKSSFRIGHPKTNMNIHDMIIDFGIEKGNVERLKIIYKYIMMLSGNKNEN